MSEKTGLERMEEEVEGVLFGNPTGVNSTDKTMLEISDTNKLIVDAYQSENDIAVRMIHRALVETQNRNPKKKRVQDATTGNWRMEVEIVDDFTWLSDLRRWVLTNQLTIRGYSRLQHLRQHADYESIIEEEFAGGDNGNWFSRLFGVK